MKLRKLLRGFEAIRAKFSSIASTSTSFFPPSVSNSSALDLDFVLGLLDSSRRNSVSGTINAQEVDLSMWSKFKFKVVPATNDEGQVLKEEGFDGSESPFITNAMKAANDVKEDSGALSSIARLQNLANTVPTKIYDRNGHGIPLNLNQASSPFFDLEKFTALATTRRPVTEKKEFILPILNRGDRDWTEVTLASVLRKLVPPDALKTCSEDGGSGSVLASDTGSAKSSVGVACQNEVVNAKTEASISETSTPLIFNYEELKLLDRDQLHALANSLNVPCQKTDFRIEQDIFKSFNSDSQPPKTRKSRASLIQGIVPWTEENERSLVKIFDLLRQEKRLTDLKLEQYLSKHSSATGVKASKSGGQRGFWHILAERFSETSGHYISMSECRKKLLTLKRIKS